MVVHSAPLMIPMFFTDKMVKKRSLSALSFQFLLFMMVDAGGVDTEKRHETQGGTRLEAVKSTARSMGKLVVRNC